MTLADEDTNSILADNAKGAIQGNALLVKVSTGVKKGTKMSKVDLCFSSNKVTKLYLLYLLNWL